MAAGVNFDWIERLLPQLILLPQSGGDVSNSDRETVRECILLAERLLAGKDELLRLESMIVEAERHRDEGERKYLLETFFARQTFLGDRTSEAGKLLYEIRLAEAQTRANALPKGVLGWLTLWDRRVEGAVAEHTLREINQFSLKLCEMNESWRAYVAKTERGRPSLMGRLRAFFTARKVEKQARKNFFLEKEVAERRRENETRYQHVARLAGLAAVFFKVPVAQCGMFSARVQQLVLLALEKEVTHVLHKMIHETMRRVVGIRETIQAQLKVPDKVKKRIDELEVQKANSLISLYAKKPVDIKQVMSDAASYQVRSAFAVLEEDLVKATDEVNRLQGRLGGIKGEIYRLARIMEDHLNQMKGYGTNGNNHITGQSGGTASAPRATSFAIATGDNRSK